MNTFVEMEASMKELSERWSKKYTSPVLCLSVVVNLGSVTICYFPKDCNEFRNFYLPLEIIYDVWGLIRQPTMVIHSLYIDPNIRLRNIGNDFLLEALHWDVMMASVCALMVDVHSPVRRLQIKDINYVEDAVDQLFEYLKVPTCRLHKLVIGNLDDDEKAILMELNTRQCKKIAKEECVLTLLYAKNGLIMKMNQDLLRTLFEFL